MVGVERILARVPEDDVGRDGRASGRSARRSRRRSARAGSRRGRGRRPRRRGSRRPSRPLRRRIALTLSTVCPSSFHSSPDSPRSPNDKETTVAVPPFAVVVAIAPAARQTKSAECALTTRSFRESVDGAISGATLQEARSHSGWHRGRAAAAIACPGPKREESHGRPHDAAVPRRPRRQPASAARAPARPRGRRGGAHRRRRRFAPSRTRRSAARCALQRDVGLQAVTDGEFRRTSWHMDFIYGLDGISTADDKVKVSFHNEHGDIEFTAAALHVERTDRRVGDDLRRRVLVPAGAARTAQCRS